MLTLGIDVGGTKINFVLLKDLPAGRHGKKIVKYWKILTPKTRKELVETLKKNIPQGVKRIGIGVPGPLNQEGELALNPPHLRALHNCPSAKIIEKETEPWRDRDTRCMEKVFYSLSHEFRYLIRPLAKVRKKKRCGLSPEMQIKYFPQKRKGRYAKQCARTSKVFRQFGLHLFKHLELHGFYYIFKLTCIFCRDFKKKI